MAKYVVSRLGQTLIVLFLVALVTFILINVAPGDPVDVMLEKRADEATKARVREQLGLDKPYTEQFVNFIFGAVRGDLGKSYFQRKPVTEIVAQGFFLTIRLGLLALLVSTAIGLVIGTLAAIFRGKWLDRLLMILAMIGISAPVFWLAVLMQLVFGLYLRWLPISGQDFSGWIIMPVICLGVSYGASSARLVRTNMIEVLSKDYVRTARSKGLSEFKVIGKHVLKNAGISIITLVGMQLRSLISGAMVVETVFSLRGLGMISYDAIMARDIPLVQGCVLYTAIVYVLVNLLIDLLYGVLDPRVRLTA